MWINIEQSDGTKYGDGPITTATSWVSRPRLDKPGKFSFRCPVGEHQAAEIVAKRHVHCYGIVNGAVAELGVGGIIDSIETIVEGDSPYLLVSGDDLLRDLRRHIVGDLELYDVDGSYSTPENAYYHYALGEIDIYMTEALDGNTNTEYRVAVDDKGFIYVGHETRFTTIRFVLEGIVNNNAATLEGQYYSDVTGWSDVSNLSDGTLNGGNQTWNQTGDVTFDRPDDWAPTVHDEKEQYWVRIDPTSTTDSIDFSEIQIKAEIASTTPIADIMAYAPAGWSVEDEAAGADPEPANLPKLQFGGESVLTALQKLAEDTGEHFRLGSGKTLVWIQSTVASGIRAIGAHGGDSVSLKGNAVICLIESLRVTEDHYEVATRVYPYGAGRGIGRVTLANATDSKAGYTIDTANNYIVVDTESAGTREERTLRFPEIGTEYDDAVQSEGASNDLLTAAHEWLSRHIAAQEAYRVSVLKLDGAVEPGETLDVFYQEYRDGTQVVDIDATLHVLEATHEINGEGVRTTALYLGSVDTWPQSGGAVVADLSHRVARLETGDEATAATRIYQQIQVLELEDAPFVVLAATPSFTNERVLTPGDGLDGTDDGAGSTYTLDVDVSDFAGTGLEDDGSENLRIAAAAAGDGLQGGAGSALAVDVSDFAGTGLEDDGSENLRIAAAAAGDGLQGGAGSALAVDVSDFAGTNLEDDGSENLRIAASAAGAGLTGGGASVLAVGAGTGITVNANDVAVDLTHAFTWAALHTFNAGLDVDGTLEFQGPESITTTSGDLTVAPAGNNLLNPTGNYVNPVTAYDVNLGSIQKPYLTGHFAELWAQTLVAQETIATIGGHVMVGPTSYLTRDIAFDDTTIYVKHNEIADGDTIFLRAHGWIEYMSVDSGWSNSTQLLDNPGFETAGGGGADIWADWTENLGDGALANEVGSVKAGDDAAKVTAGASANTNVAQSATVVPGKEYRLVFWTRGDGTYDGRFDLYDVSNSTYLYYRKSTGVTGTTYGYVSRYFTAPPGCTTIRLYLFCPGTNGGVAYFDQTFIGLAEYSYTVTRDLDDTGANAWIAGDAVFNTGNVGDGFIDLYSVHGIKSLSEVGPTIVGNVRNSTTYNDWTPHWAIGNLNGVYGYSETTYGVAFGKYEDDFITIEAASGIRMYANNILVGQWQTNADLILGQVATDKANLFWDQSEGRLNFRGGTDGVAVMAYIDTDGSIMAAGGELALNDDGIAAVATTTLGTNRLYKIVDSIGGNIIAYFGARQTPDGTNLQHAEIKVYAKTDYQSRIHLESLSPNTDLADIRLHSDSGGLDAYLWIRSTFGGSREMILELDKVTLTLDKTTDLAAAAAAFDDAYADDWNNVADFYSMDRRRREDDGRIVPVDDLAILRGILASGVFDERTGLELIDDATLPEWLLTHAKEAVDGKRAVLRDSEGRPYLSAKMVLSLLMGAMRQADARLDVLEGVRG